MASTGFNQQYTIAIGKRIQYGLSLACICTEMTRHFKGALGEYGEGEGAQ